MRRKRLPNVFIWALVSAISFSFSTFSVESEDLTHLQSLKSTDFFALCQAITDLMNSFGNAYPKGASYLERLRSLQEQAGDPTIFENNLSSNDPGTLDLARQFMVLKHEALLSNPLLNFDELIFVRRKGNILGLSQNWQGNSSLPKTGYDNAIVAMKLAPESTGEAASLRVVYQPDRDVYAGDITLHWDGSKMLFSSINDLGQWHLYEISTEGGVPVQVTPNGQNDVDYYDGCYLPDERIILSCTAGYKGVPCVYGSDHVANLFLLDRPSGNIRQLCFDQDHNWCPCVLPNGRVLYQRWEYSDTPHSNTRMLFHMNPDGTDQREFWGSGVYFPNSFFYAKPVPGAPGVVAGIASGHHGTQRSGRLLVVRQSEQRGEGDGVIGEIPHWEETFKPIIRDRLVDGVFPQFIHPYPLSEKYFLVSVKIDANASWGIYLVDLFGNMTLVREEKDCSLFEPVPIRSQMRPPILPDRVNLARDYGEVYMQDVYEGGGLAGVSRGEVKALRIFEYYFSHRGQGGLLGTLGNDSGWDIKRVLGTVPVNPDGSARFRAPANTPLSIQPLDKDGQALQIMRSWFTLQPGEQTSCVGCHESQRTAPPSIPATAFRTPPETIAASWESPVRGFSFSREVQPVLDRYCSGCHGDAPPQGININSGREFPYLRGDRMVEDWGTQISGGVGPEMGGRFSESYAQLQRFVRRPGIESDMRMLSPLDYHFSTTELGQLLRKGHYNVQLDPESWERLVTWIDLNAPYHGTWGETHPRQKEHAPRMAERFAELRKSYAAATPIVDLEYIPPTPYYESAFINPKPLPDQVELKSDSPGWGFDPATALAMQEQAAMQFSGGSKTMTLDLGSGVTMEMVLVPGGQFVMGSPKGHMDENPASVVKIAPFWMSRCEVTNEQYLCFDPKHESRDESRNGYQFGRRGYCMDGPKQPVVRVSWEEALAFCNWISNKTGAAAALPMEDQWEWACRAGSPMDFSFGQAQDDFSVYANLADIKLRDFIQCTAQDYYESARPIVNPNRHDDRIPRCDQYNDNGMISVDVGSYQPNPFGLHDMHGNVAEWTRSAYAPYPYKGNDGRNALEDKQCERVARGGSWHDRPCRSTASFRLPYRSYQRVFNVGIRVIIPVEQNDSAPLMTQ